MMLVTVAAYGIGSGYAEFDEGLQQIGAPRRCFNGLLMLDKLGDGL